MSKKPFRHAAGTFNPPTFQGVKSGTDRKTNRNSKMIQILLRPDVNGLFLFFIEGRGFSSTAGFVMPPGLSADETANFENDFQVLFETYAKKAMSPKPND